MELSYDNIMKIRFIVSTAGFGVFFGVASGIAILCFATFLPWYVIGITALIGGAIAAAFGYLQYKLEYEREPMDIPEIVITPPTPIDTPVGSPLLAPIFQLEMNNAIKEDVAAQDVASSPAYRMG